MFNVFNIFTGFIHVTSIVLRSYISGQGLHGTISFIHLEEKDSIKILTNLSTTLQYPDQVWSWFVTEYPVDYVEIENRCNENHLGKEEQIYIIIVIAIKLFGSNR